MKMNLYYIFIKFITNQPASWTWLWIPLILKWWLQHNLVWERRASQL